MKRTAWLVLAGLLLATAGTASPAQAQIWKKIKEKAQERLDAKTDTLTDKALDATEHAIRCVAGDKACVKKAQAAGQPVVMTDKSGNPLPTDQQATALAAAGGQPQTADKAAPPGMAPGEGAWNNFDFVPGEKVIFKTDFTGERIGNFPRKLEFVTGNAEVVTWNGGTWLRAISDPTVFAIPLPQVLPNRFTMEFQTPIPWWGMIIYAGPDGNQSSTNSSDRTHSVIQIDCCNVGIAGEHSSVTDPKDVFKFPNEETTDGHVFDVKIAVDGKYVKLYLDNERLANIPNGDFGRTNKLFFALRPTKDKPIMITNISVNVGGQEMYEAILQNGRFATQGILFDVDSDHIRPESTPTLNDIVDMMKAHADLKILVEGHTDNTGDAAHNQTLSEQRAASVVKYLTTKGGVDASRLTSKGFGSSKPAQSNDTPEGRQGNRRVELVKQ